MSAHLENVVDQPDSLEKGGESVRHPVIPWVRRAGSCLVGLFLAAAPFTAGAVESACSAGTALPGVQASTPSQDFAALPEGALAHLRTGKVWKRCAEGQVWQDGNCTGEALGFNWNQSFARAMAATGRAFTISRATRQLCGS